MKHTNLFTEKDRKIFDRIDRDCLAMHVVPPPKTFLKLEVRNGAGELTDVYEDRAHSWVRNAYNIAAYFLAGMSSSGTTFGAGSLACKQANDGNQTNAAVSSGLLGNVGSTDLQWGINVGSGSAAETFESKSLATRIENGNGANQLAAQIGVAGAPSYNAGTKKWTATKTRVFNNNSGGEITVREVAFNAMLSGVSPLVVCRDLLAEAKVIPNAGQLTVIYTVEMLFPA